MSELRTIYISTAGVKGYMWLHGYDRLLNAVSADAASFGLVPASSSASVPPTTWVAYNAAFDQRDLTVPLGEIRIGFFCAAGTGSFHGTTDGIVPGDFWAWLDVTDSPEVEPFNCGKIRFV